MHRLITVLLTMLLAWPLHALERVSAEGDPITLFRTSEPYDDVKALLELAITGEGLKVSKTLHIGEMYRRTAEDLALGEALYSRAEAFEFCSILLAYQMSAAHPANLANCPLTIGFYTPAGEENAVYITYRNPQLLGEGEAVALKLRQLLEGIIREALE